MIHHHPRDKAFTDVAMAIILVGVFIMSYGGVAWLWNWYTGDYVVTMPMMKLVGGLIVMCLGYIVLELELIRERQ